MGEASHPGPEFRRLRRGSVRNVVPRVEDRDVDVTDDEDDIPLSAMMTPVTQPASFVPTWIDSPERVIARSDWSPPQVIRDRGSTVFDMTEADTDSDDDFVFDPVNTDDGLSDTLIDALQQDLEHNVTPAEQHTVEVVEDVSSSPVRHDTPIDATVDPRSRSVESFDGTWAVSVSRALAGAVHDGRIAGFAHRGVKRLLVVPREGIHERDEVIIEDDGTAVSSPHSAQDAFLGARSDLCMGDVIEPVAEVPIMETVNDERTSVVGELDRVSDVADEDDRWSEDGGPDPVESEVEEQPPFRLPGVASLMTGFTFDR